MRARTIAAGVVVAALTGTAVPLALTSSASATGSTTPTITKCTPSVATIGKKVTIHGTNLAGATKVTISGKKATLPTKPNGAESVTVTVPTKGVGTSGPDKVKVVTPNGSATNSTACSFKKPAKKSKK